MEKFKKIDKEFCLTDNSVNVYKYRLLTEGLQLDQYKKNPIGFMMHEREGGVLVKWEDFRTEGDRLYGKPVINLSHPKGEDIAAQVENGFINAASMGKIICLAATDDPKLKLEGQTGPTVTKWFPREISFVDIPGNHNALANLYDIDDNELNLADFVKPKIEDMSKNLLAASLLTALNLSDNSSENDVNTAIQNLVDKANKVDGLTKDLADKTTELETLKKSSTTKEVADLVDKGIADKKLTKDLADKLTVDYAENPTGLKSLIDSMAAQVSVVDALADKTVTAEFEGKTWDDLYESEKLETVRTKYPDLYEKLKNEKYPQLKS
jgi:Mu-like prophage I protein